MTWFRCDDKLWSHPKWRAISKGARALWTTAGTWSCDQVTDGFVPPWTLPMLDGTQDEVDDLVRVRLWHAPGDRCSSPECPGSSRPASRRDSHRDAYVIHDFWAYNFSHEQVTKKRASDAERQRRARERAREQRESENASRRDSRPRHGPPEPEPEPLSSTHLLEIVSPTRKDEVETSIHDVTKVTRARRGGNGSDQRRERLGAFWDVMNESTSQLVD